MILTVVVVETRNEEKGCSKVKRGAGVGVGGGDSVVWAKKVR